MFIINYTILPVAKLCVMPFIISLAFWMLLAGSGDTASDMMDGFMEFSL